VAKRQPARASDEPELVFPAKKSGRSPEETARAAVARRPITPSGRVSYTLTLALPRDVAERLTAQAIREAKKIEASRRSSRRSSRRRRGGNEDPAHVPSDGSRRSRTRGLALSMTSYLIVALGSAIGGALRHAVNVGAARLLGIGWPYGTFTVNIVGSFTIGLIVGYFALKANASQAWLLFLTTGVLGGFTTFSAFSLDVALLYERGQLGLAALYLVGVVALSVGALFLALAIVRRLA
jgi:fluoride exporter